MTVCNVCFSDEGEGISEDDEEEGREKNPLLVDMEGKERRDRKKMDMWFSKVGEREGGNGKCRWEI